MMLDEFDDRVIKIDVAFSENWEARRFNGIMKIKCLTSCCFLFFCLVTFTLQRDLH